MSWASLAGNQCVSFTDLQDAVTTGVFTATGTAIPASNQLISKGQVSTYVFIDASNSGFSAKAATQLITRNDLQSAANTLQAYSLNNNDGSTGWATAAEALAGYTSGVLVSWSYTGSLDTGTALSGGPAAVNGTGDYYVYYNGAAWQWIRIAVDGETNTVAALQGMGSIALSVVSDTIPPGFSSTPDTVYISDAYTGLSTGAYVYTDAALTLPYLTFETYIAETGNQVIYHYSGGQVLGRWANATSCKLGSDPTTICSQSTTLVYYPSFNDIGPGVVPFLDEEMNIPVDSPYILDMISGIVYPVSNGVVGADSGYTCS
jgi:hypothetical protein